MAAAILLTLAAQTASYTFTIEDPAEPRVEARLVLGELEPDARDLLLTMPEGFAYVQLPEPRLEGEVRRVGEGPAVIRGGAYSWTIDPADAREVELRWSVPLDHRTLDGIRGRDEYEYPYLAADHGMLVMATMALVPGEGTAHDREFPITIEFDLPSGWEVHAPWPQDEQGRYRPATLNDVRDDLVAIGQWDTYEEEVDGMAVTFAFAPGQETLKQGVVQQAAPIVAGMIDHFGGKVQDRYLVLFGDPQPGGYGGSPKTNSMTLFLSPELPLDFALDGIVHLIAHEFHHTWMRARCQPVSDLRFVAEGYTDYFAYRIPWQIGLADDATFKATLEQKLVELEAAQAASEMDLFTAGGDAFFQGGDSYRATYAGGLIHALWLDLALRGLEEPSSTEAVLRALYEDPRWQDGTRPQPSDLWACIERLGGVEIAQRARELAATAGFADWQAALAAVGVELERSTAPGSLQMRANFNGTTMGLSDPAGAAARVGLLPGDRLIEVNGVAVETEADVRRAFPELLDGELRLRLERDGEELLIKTTRPTDVRYRFADKVIERLR